MDCDMNTPDNPPAFPHFIPGDERYATIRESGMTLRDYFAAKAMQGYCTCPSTVDSWSVLTTAEQAYQIADAMLKEREK